MSVERDRIAGLLSCDRQWQRGILATVVLIICAVPAFGEGAGGEALSQHSKRSELQGVLKGSVQSSGWQ